MMTHTVGIHDGSDGIESLARSMRQSRAIMHTTVINAIASGMTQ
jgi:hypothetical protein